jgi:hypothetical protein
MISTNILPTSGLLSPDPVLRRLLTPSPPDPSALRSPLLSPKQAPLQRNDTGNSSMRSGRGDAPAAGDAAGASSGYAGYQAGGYDDADASGYDAFGDGGEDEGRRGERCMECPTRWSTGGGMASSSPYPILWELCSNLCMACGHSRPPISHDGSEGSATKGHSKGFECLGNCVHC